MEKQKRQFVTKAHNAYDLLKEVRTLILEEPRRYNQNEWMSNIADIPDGYTHKGVILSRETRPACNTVGCRAGWVNELAHPNPRSYSTYETGDEAAKILGITTKQAEHLFAPFDDDDRDSAWGTVENAKKGARGITVFMAHHKKQLQAKRITPPKA